MQKGIAPVYILIAVLVIVVLTGGAYFLGNNSSKEKDSPKQVVCTQEVKICPDGSGVGRVGPNCEFAPCPSVTPASDETANWKTYTNSLGEYSIKYPADWYLLEKVDNNINKMVPIVDFSPSAISDNINSGEKIGIDVYENSTNLKIEDFIQSNIMGGGDISFINFKSILIDGLEGKQTSDIPGMFTQEKVFISRGSRVYIITWIRDLPGKKIETGTFDEIISTFKFIN